MSYILSLDQGTTSCRAIVFDRKGSVVSSCQKALKQYFPNSGFVEHDPIEIWKSQLEVAQTAISQKNIKSHQIKALGITNQRETTIIWDRKTSKPVMKAIVWQDRRTKEICQKLKYLEQTIHAKTGLVLDPYFSASKIKWILENIDTKNKDLAFGTVDSWLIWNLTNGKVHATDVTNASRTLLFNIHNLAWDQELCDMFNVPINILPKVFDSSYLFEQTDPSYFGERIPIAAAIGDQQASMVGQGCIEKGMTKCTYGTGCFLLMNTGEKPIISRSRLLTTVAWKIKDKVNYAIEGSIFNAGSVIDWVRDNMTWIQESKEIDEMAQKVEDTEGVMFVPAFTGLAAPFWDPSARGMILGLSRSSNKYHLCRASLEGIALQVYDLLQAMISDTDIDLKEIRVDGKVVNSNFLMQFQSDILNTKIIRPKVKELTALGAAILAGIAVEFFDEIPSFFEVEKTFISNMDEEKREKKLQDWSLATSLATSWSHI